MIRTRGVAPARYHFSYLGRSALLGIALLVSPLAAPATDEGALQLTPFEQPKNAQSLHVPASGQVALQLSGGGTGQDDTVTLQLSPFWNQAAKRLDLTFVEPADESKPHIATARVGRPIIIDANKVPFDDTYWGFVEVKKGDSIAEVPLVLSRAGPPLMDRPAEGKDALTVPFSGRRRLRVDVRGHVGYGKRIRLELSRFTSQDRSHVAHVKFTTATSASEEVAEFQLTPETRWIDFEIDARALEIGKRYLGQLIATVDQQLFPPVEVALQRNSWTSNVTLEQPAPVTSVTDGCYRFRCAPSPATLVLRAASGDQPIVGITVTNTKAATETFDPQKDLDISLVKSADRSGQDAENPNELLSDSLWVLNTSSWDEVDKRSIDAGSQALLRVEPRRKLPVGKYVATLKIHALNAEPATAPSVDVTFVVRRAWMYPFSVLIAGVFVSYLLTKGISLAYKRTTLQQRIRNIRNLSWLRQDRWGAMPIVRAFATIAVADAALQRERGLGKLRNFIKAPRVLEDYVAEVEDRLPFLRRLNHMALTWRAAPSVAGATRGKSNMIERRAQKVINGLVDDLSDLQRGEKISPEIESRLAALEGWKTLEHLESGYWAHLRSDVQALYSVVQLDPWDKGEIEALKTLLHTEQEKAQATPALQTAFGQALAQLAQIDTQGCEAIRTTLESVLQTLPVNQSTALRDALDKVEDSDREVVRRLWAKLAPATAPDNLGKAVEREEVYSKLKLVWEQRKNEQLGPAVFALAKQQADVEEFFQTVDDSVWRSLKGNGNNPGITLADPARNQDIEAYAPVTFAAVTDPSNADTYLFKHGLSYEWSIRIYSTDTVQNNQKPDRTLTPITRAPQVTQFVPGAYPLIVVGVTVVRDSGETIANIPEITFKTVESKALSQLWTIGAPDVVGTAVALILATVAGVQSEAFQAALMGSWNQYALLFGWGIAADQGKNLLQNVNRLTGTTTEAS